MLFPALKCKSLHFAASVYTVNIYVVLDSEEQVLEKQSDG